MAKQRGVVQLSGRVDNLCYFERKYVRGGLVRRINLAMSERLKSDPVYENTRKANSIFGMCSMAAGTLLECFGLGTREMLVPEVQSKLTKTLLKIFKSQDNHNYGDTITGSLDNVERISREFNSFSRNKGNPLTSFFPTYVSDTEATTGTTVILPSNLLEDYCKKRNLVGLRFRIYRRFYAGFPGFNSTSGKYIKGSYTRGAIDNVGDWKLSEGDFTLSVHSALTLGPPDWVVVYAIGLRSNADGSIYRDAISGFYHLIASDA